MSQVKIVVNEKELLIEDGSLLIDVLIKNHMDIPYFCYHEALGSDGNCRMCMVEIEGQKRPQIACDTFVKDGMGVKTKSENINKVRQDILELELINHPVDCPTCDQAGECKLQDFYMDYGLHDSHVEIPDKVNHQKKIDVGSSVMLDQERCVLCARCTRFVSDITKTHELGIIGRGDHARVSTMPGRKLDNPYAMNVVDLCPVGALTSKDFRFSQRSWFLTSTPAICQGCAKGCNIYIDHNREKYKDNKIHRFRPRRNDEVNGHFICDEGRLSYKTLQENRQLKNLYNGSEVNEEEAVAEFQSIVEKHKGSITILADANLYTEELEAIQLYSQKLGATLISPLESYIDKLFEDDWLKSSNRAANANGVKKLKIDDGVPKIFDTGLLINFNHPDADKFSAKSRIDFQSHVKREADLILALAVYSENSGTLINEDGVSQYSKKAIHRNEPLNMVIDWLEKLSGGSL